MKQKNSYIASHRIASHRILSFSRILLTTLFIGGILVACGEESETHLDINATGLTTTNAEPSYTENGSLILTEPTSTLYVPVESTLSEAEHTQFTYNPPPENINLQEILNNQ